MKKTVGIILTAGVVAIAAYFIFTRPPASPPKKSAAISAPSLVQTNQVAELQKKLVQKNREVARLKTENKALWEGLSNAVEATAAPLPKAAPDESAAGIAGGAGIGKMIKAAMQQQVEMKIGAMKSRLRLTDEQAQAVRKLLEEQFASAGDMASKMFEGKMSREELAQQGQQKINVDAELEKILTPEQWAEYQVYQVEERRQQAQMVANVETMQLQNMLQLSAQQREQVQAVLTQQAELQFAATKGDASAALNMDQYLDQYLNAKKEAVRAVLTPEQQQSYDKFFEAQREMIKSMLGGKKGQTPTP